MGEQIRSGIDQWIREMEEDVRNILEAVSHRAQYGSPPLVAPSEDVEVSPRASLDAKQERIFRRRKLLGLPVEEWQGIGGKKT